jgi:hypothetical protein
VEREPALRDGSQARFNAPAGVCTSWCHAAFPGQKGCRGADVRDLVPGTSGPWDDARGEPMCAAAGSKYRSRSGIMRSPGSLIGTRDGLW